VKPHVAGDVYCVLGASEWPRLDQTLRAQGFHWSATIIWVKDVFVLGRSKYHRRYEPLWYGWHEKGKSSFLDRRDVDDVWEIPRPKRSEEHPTMKPVLLPTRAILNSSLAGDIVVDPFGGSGSRLIAAEQTSRRAYVMELEPIYCSVIVQRWEKFSGRKAIRSKRVAA
jgi:DNA modification methylase